MDFNTNTIDKITSYVEALSKSDQKELLNALERKVLMDEAIRLNKSVRKNSISMKEICAEINEVRRNRKRA